MEHSIASRWLAARLEADAVAAMTEEMRLRGHDRTFETEGADGTRRETSLRMNAGEIAKTERDMVHWRRDAAQASLKQGFLMHVGPEALGMQDMEHLIQSPTDFLFSKSARAGTNRNEIDEARHGPLMKAVAHARRAFEEHPVERDFKNRLTALFEERRTIQASLRDCAERIAERGHEVHARLMEMAPRLSEGAPVTAEELSRLKEALPFAKADTLRLVGEAAIRAGLSPERARELTEALRAAERIHGESAVAAGRSRERVRSDPFHAGVAVDTPDGPVFTTFETAPAAVRPAVRTALRTAERGLMAEALWHTEARQECAAAAVRISRAYGLATETVTAAAERETVARAAAPTLETVIGRLAL